MKFILGVFLFALSLNTVAQESTCYGTTNNGRLGNGVKLPRSGFNFESYGNIPSLVGRTYVHSKVKEIILQAYKMLETEQPEKRYKYAETG